MATTTEPAHSRARVPHQEKPPQWEACTPQLEKAHVQPRRPSTVKNKEIKKKKEKTSQASDSSPGPTQSSDLAEADAVC